MPNGEGIGTPAYIYDTGIASSTFGGIHNSGVIVSKTGEPIEIPIWFKDASNNVVSSDMWFPNMGGEFEKGIIAVVSVIAPDGTILAEGEMEETYEVWEEGALFPEGAVIPRNPGFFKFTVPANQVTQEGMYCITMKIIGGNKIAEVANPKYQSMLWYVNNGIGAAVPPADAIDWDYTCFKADGVTPLPGVKTWITLDEDGLIPAPGTGIQYSDSFGKTSWKLRTGTVYVWRVLAGFNFDFPDIEVVG